MNRGIYKIIISILIVMELGFVFLSFKAYSNQPIEEIKEVNKVEKEQFSMYIEQDDGTYKREKKTNYLPSTGYKLNKDKTYCEDTKGNEIVDAVSFDSGKLTMTSSKTMYCTLYFDMEMCSLASDSTVEAGLEGAKYTCKVDPNKDRYTFYLLDNNTDGTSDLIMNANINAAGEAVIPGVTTDTGKVAWYADEDSNIHGPVTAMTYLHNATKSWSNVEPLNYTYNDREVQGITFDDMGYESFISTNGVAQIRGIDGNVTSNIGTELEPMRARMPIYSSDANITEVADNIGYLIDNLDINNLIAYWTLSSAGDMDAIAMGFGGYKGTDYVNSADFYGVRPVITVKL